MATLRELIIKISANSRSFQSEISRASRIRQFYRTCQEAEAGSPLLHPVKCGVHWQKVDQINTAKSFGTEYGGGICAGAFALSVHVVLSLADEWNSVNARSEAGLTVR